MAPAATVCNSMVQNQSQEVAEMGSGKRGFALDSWGRQPAVRGASSASASESTCPSPKDLTQAKTMKLDISFTGEGDAFSREVRCETPKSKKHRIPVVDVDHCPPAPKKPRSVGRLSVMCSLKFETSTFFQKLGVSPGCLC